MKIKLLKTPAVFLLFIGSLFLSVSPAQALQPRSFVNLTIPVRHLTPTRSQPQTTLDLPLAVHKQATHSATPITWLIDQKLLEHPKEVQFFQKLAAGQTDQVGLLLEVNPHWRSQAKVPPPQSSPTAHLLNSYSPQNRRRLLDQVFEQFFALFGHYPKTVGAAYLDSTSLAYLQDQYSVNSALFGIPSLQQGLPDIQGHLPYFPYYPSRRNALVPAQSKDQRIPLTVSYWNPPALSGQNQFSLKQQLSWLQPDSETFKNLLSDFSQKDLNEFTQLSFGVDNSVSSSVYPPILKFLQQQFTDYGEQFSLHPTTQADFSSWYISIYPFTGPANYYRSSSGDDFYLHYANPFYQISLKQTGQDTFLTHLTVFNNLESETFAHQANPTSKLALSAYPLISKNDSLSIPIDLRSAQFDNHYWGLIIDSDHNLRFNPHDITSDFSLKLPDSPAYQESHSSNSFVYRFDSRWAPFNTPLKKLVLDGLKIVVLLLLLLSLFKLPPKKIFTWVKQHLPVSLTILAGAFLWSLTTVRSGSLTTFGLSFWRAHSHDSLFHLSLIESFKSSLWPLYNPNLHQALIHNYHLVYDYLLALLSLILDITSLNLYFRLIPPLLALAIGYFAYRLLQNFKFNSTQSIVSLILVFTAGSLGFIPSLIHHRSLFGGQSAFWAHQSLETLINPPLALSLLVLLVLLDLIYRWQSRLTPSRIFILASLGALLSLVKVYGWLLFLAALSLTIIYQLTKSRPIIQLLKLLVVTLLLSFLFLIPFYQPSGQLPFQFKPFWFIQTMFSAPDRLNWDLLAQKWQDLTLSGAYPKVLLLHFFGVFLFYLGNLGVRVLGLKFWLFDKFDNLTWRLIFFIVLVGLLAPLLLIQPGNSWNAIQFIYYPLFFLGLFTGPVIVDLLDRSHTLPCFLGLVVLFSLLTFPTTIGVLQDYLSPLPSTAIPFEQLRSLQQLKHQPKGITLTPPYQLVESRLYSPPLPLYADSSTAYLPALSGQPSFLSDQVNLQIMSYDFQTELKNTQRFYQTKDLQFIKDFLEQNNIEYLSGLPLHQPQFDPSSLNLESIFDSAYYPIYTVNR